MARKNTTLAFMAWKDGKNYRARGRNGSPIWTCGGILYSYNTPIGKWSDSDGRCAILNGQKYSVTTSCQQTGIQSILFGAGFRVIICDDLATFSRTER